MNKYCIVYIDEQAEEQENLKMYFEEYRNEFDVFCISPTRKTINQIVDEIIDADPDMVVLDFNLKYSDDSVTDNGDVLMQRINDRKPYLPVALLTSFMKDAESAFLSPEKKKSILDKSMLNEPGNSRFKDEVLSHIIYYRTLLINYRKELSELLLKEEKSGEELARITELDIILEDSVDRQSSLKAVHKTNENIEDLKELLESTRNLIKEFKNDSNV